MIRSYFIWFWITLICAPLFSQNGFDLYGRKHTKIKFQLIDNLIIIPIEINGVTLSFIFDSGVSRPILFNIIQDTDTLKFKNVEQIHIRGLGDGAAIAALKSSGNTFKVGKAVNLSQDVYIISDPDINFTLRLGIQVHGIIGYDIFKDFIVEMNYGSKFIRLNDPEYFSKDCRKCEILPLTLVNNKPYIDVAVEINQKTIPVKLLMDSGGSDALWLFENDSLGLVPPDEAYFVDYLGKGLSGSMHGKRSKLAKFSLKSFHLTNINVAYPDSAAIRFAKTYKERNGSLGGELLKRFNIIMDYKNSKVTFKKNRHYKDPFEYNKSGIILEQDGVRVVLQNVVPPQVNSKRIAADVSSLTVNEAYKFALKPAFRIIELRSNSPAERAGLKLGDVIISVNHKEVARLKLQEVTSFFKAPDGHTIKLEIDREGVIMEFHFRLESLW